MQIYRLANTRRKEFLVHKTDHKIILSTKYFSLGYSQFTVLLLLWHSELSHYLQFLLLLLYCMIYNSVLNA